MSASALRRPWISPRVILLLPFSLLTAYTVSTLAFTPPSFLTHGRPGAVLAAECADPLRRKGRDVNDGWTDMDIMCIIVAFFRQHAEEGKVLAIGIQLLFSAFWLDFYTFAGSMKSRSYLLSPFTTMLVSALGQIIAIGVALPAVYVPLFMADRSLMKRTTRPTNALFGILNISAIVIVITTWLGSVFIPTSSSYWLPICIFFQFSPLALLPSAIFFPSHRSSIPSWCSRLSTAFYLSGVSLSILGLAMGNWNDATQFLFFDFAGVCISAAYLGVIEEARTGRMLLEGEEASMEIINHFERPQAIASYQHNLAPACSSRSSCTKRAIWYPNLDLFRVVYLGQARLVNMDSFQLVLAQDHPAMPLPLVPIAVPLVAGGALVLAAPTILSVVGFGAAGVVAGSTAAAVQSVIGNVAAGSLFAVAQSVGAAGIATTTTTAATGVVGVGGALLSLAMLA
ncbi:hypothetical protein BT69DRAFT_1332288 [Atractiella rhizophila]|nr:hypothetical protein BT69DRAFT_1332288 [Atractiella rhizophila]